MRVFLSNKGQKKVGGGQTPRGNLVDPALSLLPNGHQFESLQGHWRFTRSLTLGPVGLVEMRKN